MENKNEKSMTLEEMISEMLKDAKVVKVPLPAKAEEKTETQEQDKPMPAYPSGVPFLSLSIKNLHVNMDERMTSMWSTLRQLRSILANILQCKLQNKSVYDRKQLLFCWKSEDS